MGSRSTTRGHGPEATPHFSHEQLEGFAHDELRHFIGSNHRGPCPQHVAVRTGSPREEILAVLAEKQADLAILGTHRRTGFERLTLGSVTAEVMHRCRCNLLVVPPDARLRGEAAGEAEERRGPDWDFISDEMPAGVESKPSAAVCAAAG